MKENLIASKVLDFCFRVHRALGPGLLESVYSAALNLELHRSELKYECEVPIHVVYDSSPLGVGFRADFIVEDCVIFEVKSVETLVPIHRKQLLNYLKLTGLRLGLLVNFNSVLLKNGIVRIANKLPD